MRFGAIRQIGPVLTMLAAFFVAGPGVLAQEGISVLDSAQDAAAPGAPPPCGTRPIAIARMQWPSAAILAEIHQRLLSAHFACEARVVAGDMAATGSSMATTGQPAVAPEMWIMRIAEVWNQAVKAQAVRRAADSYQGTGLEGWYVPDYTAALLAERSIAGLAAALGRAPQDTEEDDAEAGDETADQAPRSGLATPMRFVTCPADWACAVINRNLVAAHGLEGGLEVVAPANRFEMDGVIAEAVSRQEHFALYYWAPNAVLEQFGFVALDMGAYDAEAFRCLARAGCAEPSPSAFAEETVAIALAEWVYTEAPAIADYFGRASIPLEAMNALLLELGQPGATVETVAERFVAERRDIWGRWVGIAAE